MTIALKLSYLGTAYHGWQRQKNAPTVQQKIEEAVEKTCGRRAVLSGCGRTDAGVHAEAYVATMSLDCQIPMERLPYALNSRLPDDIVIHEAHAVPDGFDARFSCLSKEYTYRVHNAPTRNPFLNDRAYFYPKPLDLERMREGGGHFVGRHDFAAVRSVGTPVRSTVREIYYLDITQTAGLIEISVCANGFLYNMARAIAGTLIFCGSGKLEPGDIPLILKSGDRELAGPTAPPGGLYLTALSYGMENIDVKRQRR